MIQRIQTIFLFLAAITGGLMFFFPVATYLQDILSDAPTGNYILYITGLKSMDPDPKLTTTFLFSVPLWLIAGISVFLSIITIFLYKKRYVQMRLVAFNILLNIVLVVLIFLFYISRIEELTGNTPSYEVGAFLPLVSLVLLVVANRYIRKDEALVKSADRLRG